MVAGCSLAWGLIAILVREIDLPPLAIVFYRVALSALAVASVLVALRRRDLLALPTLAVLPIGALLALHWGAYFAAIRETSVASAVLITYAAPVLMALLAPLMLGEHVPRSSIAALGLSAAGVAVITLGGQDGGAGAVRPVGVALAVLAAVSFAFLLVLVKRYGRDVDPVTWVLYESLTAAALLSPFAAAAGLEVPARDLGYLLLLGVVLTGLASVFFIGALRLVPATTAGILMYAEPVSAALLAALLLGEPLGAAVIGGGLAIVAGGLIVVIRGPGRAAGPVEQPVALDQTIRSRARA